MANISQIPRITGLAHAVPEHTLNQKDIVPALEGLYSEVPGFEKFLPAFRNTKIENRKSCVPLDWFFENHGWAERMAIYQKHGSELLFQAATLALKNANLKASEIDAILTVSTTGISAPSLENFLMDKMDFSPRVERTPIWGWGCAGGVLGLKRAAQLAGANGGQRVLLLVVELCTLSFRQGSVNPKDIIASALFGDGAAAAVIEPSNQGWAIEHTMEHRWPDSTGVMGWDVADDGLSVVFSKKIPDIVEQDFPVLYQDFLRHNSLSRSELDYFIAHPGGAKILDALEKIYDLPEGGLEDSRATLNDYGNMSSVTVLMVLERFLNRKAKSNLSGRRLLLSTFGPGFTSALMTLKKNTETL